ncbi:MAG: LytR family transcriptional regulator [Actinomycetia bacterium]|nr:LytR family transcriptional regulator [Actinomycetes bacterium]
MSDIPSWNGPGDRGDSVSPDPAASVPEERPSRRKRRGLRIALVTMASFVVLIGAVAAGGYAYVNHLAGSIPRIPVKFVKLDAANSEYGGAMTVLITGKGIGPTGAKTVPENSASGLIMLLHVNAEGYSGGVVSIPPQSIVRVPGHGRTQLENALKLGGPDLLVRTVENLTHVQINHYARIDFTHVDRTVNALRGVNVTLPGATSSFGHVFHIGVNHLNGIEALAYARQPSLSEEGRVLRQQSLMRAVIRKIEFRHLLSNPLTMYRVLHALISMLTVDSTFTASQIEHLAREVHDLTGSTDYVTAPVHMRAGQVYLDRAITRKLWAAIRQDSISAFARRYPFTVTPSAPR